METTLKKWQAGFCLTAIIFCISFTLHAQGKGKGKNPGKGPNNDCGGNCFSTQVVSAKVTGDCCTEYELKVSHDGTCRYDLSHVAFELPCGTVTSLTNSRNWNNVIGKDPTTGLNGFKIDNVSSFGKDSDSSFTVKVTICGDSTCSEKLGVVAYKAATCVDYDTLSYNVTGTCDSNGGGDDGSGGDDGGSGGDDGGSGGDDGGSGGDDGGSGGDSTQTCSTLTALIKINGTSCYGSADGSLTASVQDGNAPFTFRWSTGSTDSTITNLSGGTYSVTIMDSLGNTVTLSETVSTPGEIIISESILNASCNGVTNGSIDIAVAGGNGGYSYMWSNSSTVEDLNNVKAGLYSVTVTDSSGCSNQKTFVIANESKIALTATLTKAGCGQATGAVNLNVSGGASPYTYSWTNGATTEDIQNLSAGSYKVTVTDAIGCSAQATYSIAENNTVRVSFTTVPAGCSNEAVGAIDVTVTGGTAPYTYSWQHGATTQDVSGLTSGLYKVIVTDNLGCSVLTSINIPKKTIQVITDIVQPLCYGDSTGSIKVTPVDGTTTYTYSWSNGDTDNTLNNVPVGASYTLTITDASGCSRMLNYTITQPTAVAASASINNAQCGSEGSFAIDLTVNGGKSPYSYAWSNGSTSQDLQSLNSGNYLVTITDTNGCTLSQNVVVDPVNSSLACLINAPSYEMVCNSVGNTLGTSVADADQYSWSVTSSDNSWAITSDPSIASVVFTVGNSSTSATFNLTVVKDGCTKSCSYEVSTSCVIRDNNGGGDPASGDPCSSDTVTTVVNSNVSASASAASAVVEEQTVESSVSVYPNPFEETLNFEWVATEDDMVKLEIMDAMGRPLTEVYVGRVNKGETYKFEWTGDGLKDHMYFFRLSGTSESVYGKMFRK